MNVTALSSGTINSIPQESESLNGITKIATNSSKQTIDSSKQKEFDTINIVRAEPRPDRSTKTPQTDDMSREVYSEVSSITSFDVREVHKHDPEEQEFQSVIREQKKISTRNGVVQPHVDASTKNTARYKPPWKTLKIVAQLAINKEKIRPVWFSISQETTIGEVLITEEAY